MQETVIAAIIAGVVSMLGVVVSFVSSRWSVNLKTKELFMKAKELDAARQQLANDLESVRQSQFGETIRKRAEYYPKVWGTIVRFTSDIDDDSKKKDVKWVKDFHSALKKVDTEGGVFFSQAVYEKFHELQSLLIIQTERLSTTRSEVLLQSDFLDIISIFKGKSGSPGLAAYLKDDLGSYRDLSIQARSDIHETSSDDSSSTPLKVKTQSLIDEPSASVRTGIKISDSLHTIGIRTATINEGLIISRGITRDDGLEIKELPNNISLKPTKGILSIETILREQPGFEEILETLQTYITSKILKQPTRVLNTTDPLLTSGLIDSFSLVDLAIFIEDTFQIHLSDEELNAGTFDSLLELIAFIYDRKQR